MLWSVHLHVEAHRLLKPLLEKAITNGRVTTWLDAQHQYTAIAQRAVERPALHAVAAMAATAVGPTRTRPSPRQGAAGQAGAVSLGPVAAEGRAGREQAHPWRTRLPR